SGYQLPELFDDHGFNLARALVGTESTCVTILRAELELRPEPRHRALVLLAYPDVVAAAGAVPEINGHAPFTLEGIEDRLAHLADDGPRGGAWLMVEFGG